MKPDLSSIIRAILSAAHSWNPAHVLDCAWCQELMRLRVKELWAQVKPNEV